MMKHMWIWAVALAFLGLISCSDDAGIEIPPPGGNQPNEFAEINNFFRPPHYNIAHVGFI